MIMAKRTTRTTQAAPAQRASLRFSAINALLIAAGFAAIAIGYSMLAKGSNVGAPLLIILGYAVLIPLGIIL